MCKCFLQLHLHIFVRLFRFVSFLFYFADVFVDDYFLSQYLEYCICGNWLVIFSQNIRFLSTVKTFILLSEPFSENVFWRRTVLFELCKWKINYKYGLFNFKCLHKELSLEMSQLAAIINCRPVILLRVGSVLIDRVVYFILWKPNSNVYLPMLYRIYQ